MKGMAPVEVLFAGLALFVFHVVALQLAMRLVTGRWLGFGQAIGLQLIALLWLGGVGLVVILLRTLQIPELAALAARPGPLLALAAAFIWPAVYGQRVMDGDRPLGTLRGLWLLLVQLLVFAILILALMGLLGRVAPHALPG